MNEKKIHHSTHYIHRVSYTAQERMVGVFVLSVIAVLLFLLFSIVKNQNIFEDYFTIYGKLESAKGLSTETIVQVSGIEVGKVSAMEITDDNHIMLTMDIFNRFHKLLRIDSRVKVSSLNATIIGKSIVEITAGSYEKDMLQAGAILDIQESSSVEDVIADVTAILAVINKVVHDVSEIVSVIDPDNISSTVDSFNQMATNVNVLSQSINSGKGTVGALLYDDAMQMNLSESMLNIRKATKELKDLSLLLKNDAREVPVIMNNINSVINETETTIQATQRIWPISSAIPEKDVKKMVDPLPAND